MENKITSSLDNSTYDSPTKSNKLGFFILFLLAGLTFIFPRFFLDIDSTIISGFLLYSAIAGVFIGLALYLRNRDPLGMYWRIAFAFGTFTIAMLLANDIGRALAELILPSSNTMPALTYYWFVQSMLPAAAIILLTRISGDDLGSLYLKWGDLRKGLLIGLGFLFAISIFSFSPLGINLLTNDPALSFGDVLPMIPWIMISVLCNGIREEVLFRGLFLKKYDAVLGKRLGNLLQALIFALPHFGVAYASRVYGNIGIILLTVIIGLSMGYLTRKTDSLLAPTLVHAGINVIIWLPMFAGL